MSVRDFYIPRIDPHISRSRVGRSMVGIYKSLTRHMNVEIGTEAFSGNSCLEFSVLVLCSVCLRKMGGLIGKGVAK